MTGNERMERQNMDEKARQSLRSFIQEKLNNKLDDILTFDFKTLRESEKFGCSGRRFDGDDMEIVRAISVVGNFVVLPNLYVRGTTLNMHRGTNELRDFFDRFLIALRNVLYGGEEKDPLLEELVKANAFCFGKFRGPAGFSALVRGLLLEDYCDREHNPKIVFPVNYHWKDPADK